MTEGLDPPGRPLGLSTRQKSTLARLEGKLEEGRSLSSFEIGQARVFRYFGDDADSKQADRALERNEQLKEATHAPPQMAR